MENPSFVDHFPTVSPWVFHIYVNVSPRITSFYRLIIKEMENDMIKITNIYIYVYIHIYIYMYIYIYTYTHTYLLPLTRHGDFRPLMPTISTVSKMSGCPWPSSSRSPAVMAIRGCSANLPFGDLVFICEIIPLYCNIYIYIHVDTHIYSIYIYIYV